MTSPIKKRIDTELFIHRKQGLALYTKMGIKKQIKKLSDLREELGKLK